MTFLELHYAVCSGKIKEQDITVHETRECSETGALYEIKYPSGGDPVEL